jgi:hypothetical protein
LGYSGRSFKRRLNRTYKINSKSIRTLQNKKLEKKQKQLYELREDLNKLQSETKETIKKRCIKQRR